MNTKEYTEKKANGLVEIVRTGGGYALAIKRFNPDDGVELSPEVESIDLDSLNLRKIELDAEVNDLKDLIADVSYLKFAGKL